MLHKPICLTVIALMLTVLTVLAVPAARAFTLENSATNSDGTPKYANPDTKVQQQFGTTTVTTQQGGITTQFRTRQGPAVGPGSNDYFDRATTPPGARVYDGR